MTKTTTAEIDAMLERGDSIGALFALLRDCGLTLKLHGQPITEEELRAYAEESAMRRLAEKL